MQCLSEGDEEHDFYAIIEEWYATYNSKLRGLSLQIHDYAEVAFKEHRSAETLTGFLEGEGLVVKRGIAGDPTAFVGTWSQGEGPVVSFNAVRMPQPSFSDVRNTMHFQVLDTLVGII